MPHSTKETEKEKNIQKKKKKRMDTDVNERIEKLWKQIRDIKRNGNTQF